MCSFCGKQGIIELPIQVGDSIATICQDCVNQMASMMDSIAGNAEEAEGTGRRRHQHVGGRA